MGKRILVLVVTLAMLAAIFTGCAQSTTTTSESKPSTTAPVETSSGTTGTTAATNPSYTIAFNLFGSGAYPLEIILKEVKYAMPFFGCKVDVVDNEFTVDKMLPDLQSQLAKGVDGASILAVADSLFEPMADACAQAKVPFALYDKTPTDQAVIDALSNNKYFVGSISNQEFQAGFDLGKKAIADGNKTAILIRAAIGDYSMDQRDAGFTEAFTAGGGKVLGKAICANPTEAVAKANDLLTAYPTSDCMYGVGGDFAAGGLSALQSRTDVNQKMKIYVTDISPDWAQKLADGVIAGVNGGQWVTAALVNTLLINYLDGHPILDNNGKAPWFKTFQLVDLPADKAKAFIDMMSANGSPISEDEYKSLLYRYNPDVSYKTYEDFLANYSKMFVAKLK